MYSLMVARVHTESQTGTADVAILFSQSLRENLYVQLILEYNPQFCMSHAD